jgi:ClpP class serine protease
VTALISTVVAPYSVAPFKPRGIAAIDPQALGVDFILGPPQPDYTTVTQRGELAVIDVCGPLTHQPSGFDTYAAVESRFDVALALRPQVIVTRIASPGGDVSGAFDCARNMRRKARAAGVRWVAHSEAQACSAAYVLACAADEVWCSDSATIGSIGVIVQPVETTRADAAMGIRFETISSGARKADGNQHSTLSDEGRAAIQHSVDVMAGVFFEHVGQMRGDKLSAEAARALEAGVRVGSEALAAGLVDGISGFAELCDRLAATGSTIALRQAETLEASATSPLTEKVSMADEDKGPEDKKKEDAVRAGLVTAAASDDPDKAARAKKALAAYDSEENEDEKKDDEKAAAAATAAKAAAESATLAQVAAQAASAVAELAAMKAARESEARASLFASRADLPEAALAPLRTLPVETARAILAGIPKIVNPLAPIRATAIVGDSRIAAEASSTLTPEQRAALDAAFGISPKAAQGVVMNGVIQQFGVPVTVAGSNAQ